MNIVTEDDFEYEADWLQELEHRANEEKNTPEECDALIADGSPQAAPSAFDLSVFLPLAPHKIEVRIFTIEVDRPLNWVRGHADEMASQFVHGLHYIALNVKEC